MPIPHGGLTCPLPCPLAWDPQEEGAAPVALLCIDFLPALFTVAKPLPPTGTQGERGRAEQPDPVQGGRTLSGGGGAAPCLHSLPRCFGSHSQHCSLPAACCPHPRVAATARHRTSLHSPVNTVPAARHRVGQRRLREGSWRLAEPPQGPLQRAWPSQGWHRWRAQICYNFFCRKH